MAVADLGTDNVATYSLDDATGALTLVSSVDATPGSGPRHIAFNADGTLMYVVTEMGATIDVYAYDMTTGMIGELVQTVSAVPDPFEGTKSTAEIAIHPSGKFLYNSNRGQPDMVTPEGDAIVADDKANGFWRRPQVVLDDRKAAHVAASSRYVNAPHNASRLYDGRRPAYAVQVDAFSGIERPALAEVVRQNDRFTAVPGNDG